MKKLVVIVPAFNEEKTISDTLKGLFSVKPGLSKLGYELIIHVINDGSTDATKKIASEHMEVLIINHKKNKGLGAAVRSGLLSASNINADIVAGEVAQALKAEKLILLTDVKGIGDSENKLISNISLQKGEKLLKEEFIKGGMMPKLTSALEAKRRGVKSCHIIDGRVPHAVLLEVLTEEGVGTMIS